MKHTMSDPRKVGLPFYTQFESIKDVLLGTHLEEDPKNHPYIDSERRYHLYLRSNSITAKCPYCGCESKHHYGFTRRNPQWSPVSELPTVAHISINRYYCRNPQCKAKTFTEELTELSPFRQSSDIVLKIVFAISIFCSAHATELICSHLGIQFSHDTISRLYSNIVFDNDNNIVEVGIDDVSKRKGMKYNTAIYEANTHRLIELLDGRDGKTLKEWLLTHKDIKKVTRDRASAYATAIKEILEDGCMQVADRFHIIQNLLERIKNLFQTSIPKEMLINSNGQLMETIGNKTKKTELISHVDSAMFGEMKYNNDPVIDENGQQVTIMITPDSKQQIEKRILKMKKVIDLRKDIEGIGKPDFKVLSEKYGFSQQTIRKYMLLTDEQVNSLCYKKRYSKSDSTMIQFDNIVYKMMKDGITPDEVYCRILALGYKGSLNTLKNHISGIAYNHFGIKTNRRLGTQCVNPGVETIKRSDIIKWITIKDKSKMNDTAVAKYFDIIIERYPVIERIREIWEDGYSMVMGGDSSKVDEFIAKYKQSECEISPFVNGLEMDITAVKNGVTQKLNSGFVEGNNCKYKLILRTMYGRASTETLKRKFYVASKICRCDVSINDILQLKIQRKYYSRRPIQTSC